MFDFSFFEMLVVFVVGLLVLGPERLPKVARQIGWWVGRVRSSLSGMREELEREASLQELRAARKEIEQTVESTVKETRSTVEAAAREAQEATQIPPDSKQDSQ